MNYLILKFENAALVTPAKPSKFQHFVQHLGLIDGDMPDMNTPIGVDQLSNALHVMCGLAPCATKRSTVFQRNENIYNIAKGAYVRYDKIINQETFQNAKIQDNSTAKICDIKGNSGVYNWSYLKRAAYSSPKTFEELIRLLNHICNVEDVTKEMTVHQVADIIKEKWNNEILRDFITHRAKLFMNTLALNAIESTYHISIDRLDKNENPRLNVSNPFWYLLFNVPFSGANIVANGTYNPNAILQTHGIDYRKTKFSGTIVVPLEDNKIVEQIKENGVCPTILDGGMVTIERIQKLIPEVVLRNEYEKIFSEKKSEDTENEQVM